jgi:PAS domain S-box-containing protein
MPSPNEPTLEILKTLETVPNMYLILSPELYILTASEAYLNATETTWELIKGKHIFEAFPNNSELPDGGDGLRNINISLQTVLRTKKPDYMHVQRYDVPDVHRPGKFIQRYWEPSHTPVLDDNGEIYYIIQQANNVTDRILAEQNLIESQLKQSETIHQINNLNEELLYTNAELRKTQQDLNLLNAQLEERIAKRTTELTASEFNLKISLSEQQALNEEQAASNEEQAVSNEKLMAINEDLEAVNKQLVDAYQKIEEGENALRLAIGAANFGTWFIHSVTREFITDVRLKELFGYYPEDSLTIEQAVGQITDEYRSYVSKKLEDAIYNGGDYDVTYSVIGFHDQKLRWLRALGNLKADHSGTFSAFTGVVMDITEQYLAAKKVELAEKSLRMAIDAAGLGTYYINAADRIFVASPKLKEFFGFFPDEDVPYDAAINQIHPDFRQKAADLVEAAFNRGTRFDMEYPIIGHHDGTIRWVRGIGELQHNEGKDYLTGVLHEITESKKDELRKNDFIGMVSHELKTPLTSLNAYLQMLQAKARKADDSQTQRALDQSVKQVKRMTNMINGFLNVSRLESGKIQIDYQNFDMADLIHDLEQETIELYAPHKIIFDPVLPTIVNADKEKIGQVVINLISNAVKYSSSGSTIQVACIQENGLAKVSVSDEGIGITEEDQRRLFERYYRVENNNNKISGFGIGLYLSAEIINRHHGKIWVESEINIGSTFYFTISLYQTDLIVINELSSK